MHRVLAMRTVSFIVFTLFAKLCCLLARLALIMLFVEPALLLVLLLFAVLLIVLLAGMFFVVMPLVGLFMLVPDFIPL